MDYSADELPLPSFVEIFGDGALSNPVRKKKKSAGGKIEINGEESTGRWTPDEHRLFLEGIMLYGKDWKKMQPLIKTRSLVQIRTHAQKVFKKIGLKKIAGVMKRRGSLGKDGDVEQELEDVLDDELEHLGMMEGVDDTMLSNLAAQAHMQQQIMHGMAHPGMIMNHSSHPMNLSHSSSLYHSSPLSPLSTGLAVGGNNGHGLSLDLSHSLPHDPLNGLSVSTPMMTHHNHNHSDHVFDALHHHHHEHDPK